MPWTTPVIGAGGFTTVEEGTVGVSPHALSSDITAQSAHAGALVRTICNPVVPAGLVTMGMRFRTTGAKRDPRVADRKLLTRQNVGSLTQRRMSRTSNITAADAAHLFATQANLYGAATTDQTGTSR
jgi:hypothetical protein